MTQKDADAKLPNADQANLDYVHDQIGQVRYIYDTLYPGEPLEAHFWWEETTVDTPVVFEQNNIYGPDIFGLSYIGRHRFGPEEGVAAKRVHVTIPSPEQTSQPTDEQTAWHARSWKFKTVHSHAPIVAEDIKYRVEHRRRTKLRGRHKFRRLPYSAGVFPAQPMARDTSKAPAVLIGFHWLSYGGAEKLAFDTVDWALEQGLRVVVITDVKGPQPLAGKLPQDDRVMLVRTDQYLPRQLGSAFLPKLIARENIIATHNHHSTVLYDALPAIKMHFPDVVNIDSTHIIEHADGGYPRISGVWSNFLDYHHVISDDLKSFYREDFRVNRKAVMGRLLDDRQREATPAPLTVQAGKKTARVVFVGRMMHQKRPILVVETFRRLAKWGKRNGIAMSFDMIGEGPYRAVVRELLARYGLEGQTRLHAAGADVHGLLAEADVMILPSTNEGLALVSYEAIEQGCVPITTDVGAQREIIPDALLVPWAPRRAVAGTVNIVKRLLTEQGFAEKMQGELHDRFAKLAAEPSAKEVVSEIYAKALATAKE